MEKPDFKAIIIDKIWVLCDPLLQFKYSRNTAYRLWGTA